MDTGNETGANQPGASEPSGKAARNPPRSGAAQRPAGGGGVPDKSAVVGSGEFRSSLDQRTGLVSGISGFAAKRVRYSNVNGVGLFEGDIALGPVEKMEKTRIAADIAGLAADLPASGKGGRPSNVQFAAVIVGQRYRWPGGVIPFELQPGLEAIVGAAIAHWQQHTSIRFVARTPANATSYPNYIAFEIGDGCWSAVGMQGGPQPLSIGAGCGVGQAIHQIGHAAGLWHEQSREDRDQFVRIAWDNIIPHLQHNFDQHISDGDDIGPYDVDSIMHYPSTAFTANGLDTIVALGGQPIGQRLGLSAGDIVAVNELYPYSVGRRHFYTTSLIELANKVTDQGYRNDGIAFYGFAVPIPGALPLVRLSHPDGQYFYTTSPAEAYDALAEKGYAFDLAPCYVARTPVLGLTPLYQLEGEAQNDALFTTSPLELQQATGQLGYTARGIAGHVLGNFVPGAVPVYRLSKVA